MLIYEDVTLLLPPVLESMASNVPIIGTATGGSGEIFRDKENCLVYPPGNAEEVAKKIMMLIEDTGMRDGLTRSAYEMVRAEYTFDKMVDKIEVYLLEVSGKRTMDRHEVGAIDYVAA